MLKQAEEQRRALESQNKGGSQRLVDLERQLSSLEDTEMSLRAEKDELLAAKDQVSHNGRID